MEPDDENDPDNDDDDEEEEAPQEGGISAYEQKRLETIAKNREMLASLGLLDGGGLIMRRNTGGGGGATSAISTATVRFAGMPVMWHWKPTPLSGSHCSVESRKEGICALVWSTCPVLVYSALMTSVGPRSQVALMACFTTRSTSQRRAEPARDSVQVSVAAQNVVLASSKLVVACLHFRYCSLAFAQNSSMNCGSHWLNAWVPGVHPDGAVSR